LYALVLGSQHLLSLAGAIRHRPHRVRRLALARAGPRGEAISGRNRAVPAWLCGTRDLSLSLSCAAVADHLGDRGHADEPDVHADRQAAAHSADPRLLRPRLLDLPRQGARRRELSSLKTDGKRRATEER